MGNRPFTFKTYVFGAKLFPNGHTNNATQIVFENNIMSLIDQTYRFGDD